MTHHAELSGAPCNHAPSWAEVVEEHGPNPTATQVREVVEKHVAEEEKETVAVEPEQRTDRQHQLASAQADHHLQRGSAHAGDGAPTVSGGFAKWNVIDRPQPVGMTVLAGYDPSRSPSPIRFDNVVRGRRGRPIEDMIGDLEWMGGPRGLHLEPDVSGHQAAPSVTSQNASQ